MNNGISFLLSLSILAPQLVRSESENTALIPKAPRPSQESTSPKPAPHQHAKIALLITDKSLQAAWKPFVEWKKKRGIDVMVTTTQEIAAKTEGPDLQEKIRIFVQDNIAKNKISWLILGGDSLPNGKGLVPDRDTFHSNMWGENTDIPTDIYYLSPKNWDADGDGIYGESKDDRSAIVYPDGSVGLGRIPVRTSEDIAAYTDKVITWESNPPTGDYANSFVYTCTVGAAYAKVRKSWDDYVSKSWKLGTASRYFADETPWDTEKPGDYELDTTNWTKLFNNGKYSKMHFHGHGILQGWVTENHKLFTTKNLANLRNGKHLPMITTVSCFTGHYDSKIDPSIVEAFLRKPNAGAIAIVAPCREGKPHFTDPQRDFPLMVEEGKLDGTTRTMTFFWSHGLENNLTAGEALMSAKVALSEEAEQSANLHMCLCELNLLGDPTLAVNP